MTVPKSGLLALLLLFSVLGPALAAPGKVDLYIRNRPFEGDSRVLRGEIYAALDDLLASLGLSWSPEGERLMVWSRTGGGPALTGEPLLLVVDGRVMQVPQEPFAGRVYVSVAEFARATGGRYNWNRGLGTADYYPVASVPTGEGGPRRATDGKGSNGSPVRLVNLSYRVEAPPGSPHPVLRGYAVLRNTGTAAVEDLLLKVDILDSKGAPCGGFSRQVESLPPGQDLTWQFPVWTDFEKVADPHPSLDIEHR